MNRNLKASGIRYIKSEFIALVSKINETDEDEFKAEFNSPELMWDKLIRDMIIGDMCPECTGSGIMGGTYPCKGCGATGIYEEHKGYKIESFRFYNIDSFRFASSIEEAKEKIDKIESIDKLKETLNEAHQLADKYYIENKYLRTILCSLPLRVDATPYQS